MHTIHCIKFTILCTPTQREGPVKLLLQSATSTTPSSDEHCRMEPSRHDRNITRNQLYTIKILVSHTSFSL